MDKTICDNLDRIFKEIENGNDRGEKINLLGATKFVPVDKVNEAIKAGLTDIGENKAQEFRDKFGFYGECVKHFIGTLQENKLKYVVGKADFIDSVSSLELAVAINEKAAAKGICQKVMIEINGGEEESKTGATIDTAKALYKSIIGLKNLELGGIMALLPASSDEEYLAKICREIRAFYDEIREKTKTVKFLSIGMSGDYKIAIKNGSNMIRLGRAIFGERDYGEVK